jgi:hypothetical protein
VRFGTGVVASGKDIPLEFCNIGCHNPEADIANLASNWY